MDKGMGVIDLSSSDGLIHSVHLSSRQIKHLDNLLQERCNRATEFLKEIDSSLELRLKEGYQDEIPGHTAVQYLQDREKPDNICDDWQFENVIKVLRKTLDRPPEVSGFYCDGEPKVGKTRMLLTSAVLLGACHELLHDQKTLLQILLLSEKKHEHSYVGKDFPIIRYLFDKLELIGGKGKKRRVDISQMISRWERVASQNEGSIFMRRTSAERNLQFFARQTAYAQAAGHKLFIHVDEADEGAGAISVLNTLFSAQSQNGRLYKSVYQACESPDGFALHYHWTATGAHLESHKDRINYVELTSPPNYQGPRQSDIWDLQTATDKLAIKELRWLGVGTMPSNNPYCDIRAYLTQFEPDLVGKRNKDGDLLYRPNGMVKVDPDLLFEATEDEHYKQQHEKYIAAIRAIFAKMLVALTKIKPNVMWAHLRSNWHQMKLIMSVRKELKGKALILPYLDIEDPLYGINFFRVCKTSHEAIRKLRELAGDDTTPVVISGTAAFDRSNEFPQGIFVDSGTPAFTTETAGVQKTGRNALVAKLSASIKRLGQPINILLGQQAAQQLVRYKKEGDMGCRRSIHCNEGGVAREGIKVDFVRSDLEKFPVLKRAFNRTDKEYLNKTPMLKKCRLRKGSTMAQGRVMGGSVILKALAECGELDCDLFDIWDEALEWASQNHDKIWLERGCPIYAVPPEFQRLLNEKGRTAKLEDGSTAFRNKARAEQFKEKMEPYLGKDVRGTTLGVEVIGGKAYAHVGLRATKDQRKKSDRENSSANLQIQLFYQYDHESDLMKCVSIGFRRSNSGVRARLKSTPKDGTVSAKLMSPAERTRLSVSEVKT